MISGCRYKIVFRCSTIYLENLFGAQGSSPDHVVRRALGLDIKFLCIRHWICSWVLAYIINQGWFILVCCKYFTGL
uniref:Uncharacterized protein n=1 Tax=Rhizophora mucronata TaxID=61149 RepID=A0A2P2NAA9_RHIMU